MISAVISDLGKVVLMFDNTIFYRKMTEVCPLSVEEIRGIVHRSPEFVELFDLGKMSPREFYEWAAGRLGASIGYDEFMGAYADVFWLNRPVLDLLQRLKPKYRLILVSNCDIVRFEFIRKKFPEIGIFDGRVLSYELGLMKPDPRIYQAALKLARAEPSACIFIDDMAANVEGAAALGINGVLYTPDTDLSKELAALGVSP
jgi:putative hydrolase of the HAD superfamily